MHPQNAQAVNPQPTRTTWVSSFALLFSVLTFIFGNGIGIRLYELISPLQADNKTIVEGCIALLNVALASYVLIELWFLRPVESHRDDSIASNAFRQLLNGWKLLWGTWILFYGCLAALYFSSFSPNNEKVVMTVAEGLNLINGFFFYYLFFVLDQPSVATASEPHRASSFRQNIMVTIIFGIVVFIAAASSIWGESNTEQNSKEGVLLAKLLPAYIAVGMAFFFGRLDSHYLKLNRIILAPLYLYAVIQLYWGRGITSNEKDYERIAILILALILKFVVFYILSGLIRDEKFRRYFVIAEEGLKKSDSSASAHQTSQ